MILKRYWLLELSIYFIWLVGLIGTGIYWLWLNDLLWTWLVFSALLIAIVLLIDKGWKNRNCRKQQANQRQPDVETETEMALRDLELMSDILKTSEPDLSDIEFYFDTFYQVVQTVARRFYPEQKDAYLEIKIPYCIRVLELLAHELRLNLLSNVPGSHMLSLRQIVSAQYYAGKGMRFYGFFRKLTRGIPLDSEMLNNIKSSSKVELRDWFIDLYVRKVGHYAIEIYSGQQRIDNGMAATNNEQRAKLKVDYAADHIVEPLRILVLGQTGTGKSSCINALFGQAVAEADVIPSTKGLTAYLLNKPTLEKAIIYDSEGYGSDSQQLVDAVSDVILLCDMIILVMSAINPAREYDAQLVQHIKVRYGQIPNKIAPPIIVALTHIDQLRPWREWRPSYNIAEPNNEKARSIRTSMQIVADELKFGLDQIAPICIKPGREYNVDEGLVPTLLQNLDQAKQLRYLRCIDRYQKEVYWHRLWQQAKNAGRFITREIYELNS